MKVGLLGVGYWGSNHLRSLKALQAQGLVEGVVLADADEARARVAAKQAGCEAASVDGLLRDPSVRAVDIATPTPSHFDLAKRTLLAGKHALVEKPMTQRTAEARELVALAEGAGLVLMPGHLFRYHPGIEEARRAMAQGELGEVRYLEAARRAFREPRPDMGVLHALAIHELDLFPWLLGREPDTVQCTVAGWHRPGIEEAAWLTLRFGDVTAHAVESWASPWAGKERHLAVFGEQGSVLVDFQELRQVTFYDYAFEHSAGGLALRNEGARTVPVHPEEPLLAELQDFVRCAQGRGQPRADMHSGLRAVRLAEACAESARGGRPVPVRG